MIGKRTNTAGGRPAGGFSLTEILIALMIVAIGVTMIAGAFPVGLHYFTVTADRTTAGLLARTVLSNLQTLRTRQYETAEKEGLLVTKAEPYAQVAVDECFREDTDEVVYLWDAASHDSGGAGSLLAQQGLGADIDDWMPPEERTCGVDGRFACQVFYKRMADPLGDVPSASPTYQVFLVVQKAAGGTTAAAWAARFPGPSPEVTLAAEGTTLDWPGNGFVIRDGALLYEVSTGDWAAAATVEGSKVTLSRPLGPGKVRAINGAVAMYRGVVTKRAVR